MLTNPFDGLRPAFRKPFSTDDAQRIIGSGDSDILVGGGGDDWLIGLPGPDGLYGDIQNKGLAPGDTVPEFGNDVLIGGASSDDSSGDANTLTLNMTEGGNLTVETGDDLIDSYYAASPGLVDKNYGDMVNLTVNVSGSAGGNIQVLMGDDVLIGGRDADSFGDSYDAGVFHSGTGGEVFLDFGDDKLVGGSQLVGDSVYLDVNGAGAAAVTVVGGDDLLIGTGYDAILVGDFRLVNREGNGNGQGFMLDCGDDTIIGSSQNDYMAGDHDYSINDTVDVLKGADTFVFRDAFGNDEIVDYDGGLDTLAFEGFDGATYDDIAQSYDAAENTLTLSLVALGGGTVLLHDTATLDAGDVIFA